MRTISAAVPTSAVAAKKTAWAWTIATFFGSGLLKPGPGTWGSAATIALYSACAYAAPERSRPWIASAICVAAVIAGIPAATVVERESRTEDPGHVVIDETAGQALTLIAAPFRWQGLLAAFLLFRAFDIVKPWPVRKLEELPSGTGIVMDDIAAGVYGVITMLVLRRLGVL